MIDFGRGLIYVSTTMIMFGLGEVFGVITLSGESILISGGVLLVIGLFLMAVNGVKK